MIAAQILLNEKQVRTHAQKRYICCRRWGNNAVYFVREVLGEGGADWGYVFEPGKARPISTYWMRRFVADMRAVGAKGVCCREI